MRAARHAGAVSLHLGEHRGPGKVRENDEGSSRRGGESSYRAFYAWGMARVVVGHEQIAINGEPWIEPFERCEGRMVQSDVDVNERERLVFEPYGRFGEPPYAEVDQVWVRELVAQLLMRNGVIERVRLRRKASLPIGVLVTRIETRKRVEEIEPPVSEVMV